MPFSRYTPALVATGLLVFLIAAGVVLWSSAWTSEKAFERSVRRCVVEVARHDPVRDARTALARGDDRLYFWTHDGISLSATADGVRVGAHGVCESNAPQFDSPRWPFDLEFADLGPRCCDIDPQLTACGEAQRVYRETYNRQMARLNPSSVARYCKPLVS